MLTRYLVCYDVADPRRLAQVYRKMNGFGTPIQYSVFVCDLSPTARVQLEQTLTEILNLKEDRVLIVDTGPAQGRGQTCFATLGRPTALPNRGSLVV